MHLKYNILLAMDFYRFILYTKKNPTDGQILNVNVNKTIVKSNFSPTRLTKLIIHGFIDTPLSNWVIINNNSHDDAITLVLI